jgi:hypothetical protein
VQLRAGGIEAAVEGLSEDSKYKTVCSRVTDCDCPIETIPDPDSLKWIGQGLAIFAYFPNLREQMRN